MVIHNAVRETLERDDPVFGARSASMTPMFVEVFGELGLDFVWLDFEHAGPSAYDNTEMEHLARAADGADVELLVRIPSGEPDLVRKVLDCGVRNVLVPRVETAAEVREAVEAAHFHYDGGPGARGASLCRAAGWGAAGDDYEEREDAEVLVGCMLELETAIENVAEIVSVPELGFVYIGPGDMSISHGHPGNPDHPEVREAIATAEDACRDAGVTLGKGVGSVADAEAAIDDGYRLLRIGDELGPAREVVGERIDALR